MTHPPGISDHAIDTIAQALYDHRYSRGRLAPLLGKPIPWHSPLALLRRHECWDEVEYLAFYGMLNAHPTSHRDPRWGTPPVVRQRVRRRHVGRVRRRAASAVTSIAAAVANVLRRQPAEPAPSARHTATSLTVAAAEVTSGGEH